MSGKKLLFYLGALLLVAGGYYYSEFRHSRQTAQEQAAKKLFQVKTDDITVLTLKSDKGEIQLQRVPATDKAPEPATAASGDGAATYQTHCRQSGRAYHELSAQRFGGVKNATPAG